MDSKGGTLEIRARKGKSLDYRAVAKIIEKQRKPEWIEITVVGKVIRTKDRIGFKASVTGQSFVLAEDPSWKKKKGKSPFARMQEAIKAGTDIDHVSGRVEEHKVQKGKRKPPGTIRVTGFKVVDKVKE